MLPRHCDDGYQLLAFAGFSYIAHGDARTPLQQPTDD